MLNARAASTKFLVTQNTRHEPWFHNVKSRQDEKEITDRLGNQCQKRYDKIIIDAACTSLLRFRGSVLDGVKDPSTQAVRLIELNEFGAQSGCRAYLSH